ncbi:MAG: inositol monophosphatase [Acidobacteria bacterium]|nr:inositol monophosphatase [Acidobacteriota bacterium]
MSGDLLTTAIAAARAGGEIVAGAFRATDLGVRLKAANDFVTRVDGESERAVVDTLLSRHPDHAVLAEEGGGRPGAPGNECQWLVDPLDGTTNFLRGVPFFAVSVACRCSGRLVAAAVLEPLRGDLFTAALGEGARLNGEPIAVAPRGSLDGALVATGFPFRHREVEDAYFDAFRRVFRRVSGIRRCGSAALDLAYTAAGVFDGFFELRLAPWDIAAGALLVREAGGVISDFAGGDGFLDSGNVVAGAPGLHRDLLAEVRTAVETPVPQAAGA